MDVFVFNENDKNIHEKDRYIQSQRTADLLPDARKVRYWQKYKEFR